RNYLDGDRRHGEFVGRLCFTLAAVLLLVTAGNLFQLALAWVVTSLSLQRLLTFYRERPRARIAARKKFLVARLGDLCLLGGCLLVATVLATQDIAALSTRARALAGAGDVPPLLHAGVLLLAIAAMLKSAQFPTHGWLLEVMETPTPVSALLHAGIVNAGGFLLVRLADLVVLSPAVMLLLTAVGVFTALFASVVMLTQTRVKGSLAHSTVAQMGFMIFECGIGAFPLAVLHLVAHSLYKAHAFLASGSTVELLTTGAQLAPQAAAPRLTPARATLLLAGLMGVSLSPLWIGVPLGITPATATLISIALSGALYVGVRAVVQQPGAGALLRIALMLAAALGVYLWLETGSHRLLSGLVPPPPEAGPLGLAAMALSAAALSLLTFLQLLLPSLSQSPRVAAAYVHLRHGLYLNLTFDRLVGALRRPAADPTRLTPETRA
ncbi:MAG: proton-conducting transporter membrane subunit, partial [Myxococcales bacterium]